MSDLHFEHQRASGRDRTFWGDLNRKIAVDKPEACVLAGDIDIFADYYLGSPPILKTLALFAARYPVVLYTPGNHEFFDVNIVDAHEALKQVPANVHVLLPGKKVHVPGKGREEDLDFTGGTLWYPDCGDHWLKKRWIDYDLIKDADPEIEACHQLFMEKVLPDMGDVVVSHMFPTAESIAQKFAGANTNVFFCADIGEQIKLQPHQPQLWIHGHTHNPFDYRSQLGFRVFCNPHGYPREGANPKFFDRLLVDTEDPKWYLKTFNGGSNDD